MGAKRRGLGRGLDALLSAGSGAAAASPKPSGGAAEILVERICPGRYQPRTHMNPDTLAALAASIKAQGVVQPVVVRTIGPNSYELIAGERRWRAAQQAQLASIPAIVRDVPDEAALAMALIENIQREDLNPIEEATALKRLIDEFEMTHGAAAEAVGRSRAAVSNLLRLLELAPEVKSLLDRGELEMGHARALLPLDNHGQVNTAREVILKGLNARQTEALVRGLLNRVRPEKPTVENLDPDVRRLQNVLSEKLGAKLHITHNAKGKGRLVIEYNSLDELDGIISHIN